jgi:phage tail sheath protein FI
MPLFGGFDGLNILEKEPFRNEALEDNKTETTSYAYNTIKRAIDAVADPEVVEMNLLVVPGLTHEPLTSHMIEVCENRGDALAIIDLTGGYVPSSENNSEESANRGSVATVISYLKTRGLNTSYGAAYHPWVQTRDVVQGQLLWVPPSVAALGTYASSENSTEIWFAPAGFNRGGLTNGAAGIPIVGVREKLTSDERDRLYEQNINPIAAFPSEGIVVWGQKTLQTTPSALDRVNVRRLLIYVKKEISRMATRVLFDQNVERTWLRFKQVANPFLESVKTRYGLTDYRLVLDETTTTPDLIDQNAVYGLVYLKPARSIEFIAIDFVLTDSGAAFED